MTGGNGRCKPALAGRHRDENERNVINMRKEKKRDRSAEKAGKRERGKLVNESGEGR